MARARGLLFLGLLLGCAARIPPLTEADVLRASTRFPGTTLASLAQGRSLYFERCSSCHSLQRPSSQPAAAWPKFVREMTERAKLDAPETEALIRYLVVAAESP